MTICFYCCWTIFSPSFLTAIGAASVLFSAASAGAAANGGSAEAAAPAPAAAAAVTGFMILCLSGPLCLIAEAARLFKQFRFPGSTGTGSLSVAPAVGS